MQNSMLKTKKIMKAISCIKNKINSNEVTVRIYLQVSSHNLNINITIYVYTYATPGTIVYSHPNWRRFENLQVTDLIIAETFPSV